MLLTKQGHLRSFRGLIVAAIAVLVLASAAYAAPPGIPAVIGPIPVNSTPGTGTTRDYPQLTAEPYFDLRNAGYLEEEFFVQGFATSYQTPPMADAVEVSNGHPYRTGIFWGRQLNPPKFIAIVFFEWVKVTSGYGTALNGNY